MGIYLKNGYLDCDKIRSYGMPFNFVVGGRGTGKTFGGLMSAIDRDEKFIFMRRTQVQADLVNNPELTPFKSICRYRDWKITTQPLLKNVSGIYRYHLDDKGNSVIDDPVLGIGLALSTAKNIRGFDGSDYTELIFDEFIPETHEPTIKNEATALLNFYETVNRNREFTGSAPLRLMAFSNSENLACPIFMELGIVNLVERLKRKQEEIYIDQEKGLGIFILSNSKISEQKRTTALYRLTDRSRFAEMAIENNFDIDDAVTVDSGALREYKPVCAIGEICIYRHKSTKGYFVSQHRSGSPKVYPFTANGFTMFRREQQNFLNRYLTYDVIYESYSAERILTNYLKTY